MTLLRAKFIVLRATSVFVALTLVVLSNSGFASAADASHPTVVDMFKRLEQCIGAVAKRDKTIIDADENAWWTMRGDVMSILEKGIDIADITVAKKPDAQGGTSPFTCFVTRTNRKTDNTITKEEIVDLFNVWAEQALAEKRFRPLPDAKSPSSGFPVLDQLADKNQSIRAVLGCGIGTYPMVVYAELGLKGMGPANYTVTDLPDGAKVCNAS